MVYKRGKTYGYKFTFRSELIRRSTKQANRRIAGQTEAACRTALAKGEAGLIEPAKPMALKEFSKRFLASVEMNADRPRTPKMYRTAVNGLLGFEKLAMRLMGHSSITVSRHYVHPAAGTLERAIDGLSRLNASAEGSQNRAQAEKQPMQTTEYKHVI